MEIDNDVLNEKDITDAFMLLPTLYNYSVENSKKLGELALVINNTEVLLDFLLLYSGRRITFPKIEEVELILKMICAYKYNIDRNIKPTSNSFYSALIYNKISPTKENEEKFLKLYNYFLNKKSKELMGGNKND